MSKAADELIERRKKALGPVYIHFYDRPLYLVRGEGTWLYDDEGRQYLDCYNNVASVGHCHPHVTEALTKQAKLLNTHTRYLHHGIIEYAEKLAETMPGDLSQSILVCTGTEANDLAYRIARGATGNDGAIIVKHAYHGGSTTINALAPEYGRPHGMPDWVAEIEAPDPYRGPLDCSEAEFGQAYAGLIDNAVARLAAKGRRPAMVMIDCIYDSPGIFTPPPVYLQTIRKRINDAGGLFVADEVQSGLCRLGENYWGHMDAGIAADIVTMGKPMGDGHPLAVVTTTPAISEAFVENGGDYFNTFGGNPVAAAVGKAVLEVVEQEHLLANVGETGGYLKAGFAGLFDKHPIIGDVRGKGFFWGIELVRDRATKEPADTEAARAIELMREAGVLIARIGPHRNILKIRPPLVFRKEHADLALAALDETLAAL